MNNPWPVRAKAFLAGTSAVLRSPRWHRRAAWALGAWLALWLLAYALVPIVLRSQLQRLGSEQLGRKVSVGAVEFKPWTLELTIHDLAIARAASAASPPSPSPTAPTAPTATSPQLRIKRIYIDAELASLLRLAPVADALEIDEPAVSIIHLGHGRYDIDDVLARLNKPADAPPGKPARFSLYNLVLSGGRLDVEDRAAHASHALRELHLAVPFLSNLPSQQAIKTAPHLAFTLNGSRFDSAAVATPFAPDRKTDAAFTLRDFDLQPYLAYWPAGLPLRLQSAVLQADLKLAFEQTPAPAVRLSGSITADKVRFLQSGVALQSGAAPQSGPQLLAFERLHVALDDVRPLEQTVRLSAVELRAPVLSVTRDRAGRLNLLPDEAQGATKTIAASAGVASAEGRNDLKTQATAPANPWKVQVARLDVQDGALNWRDETLPSPAQVRLTGLAFNAEAISYPFAADAPLRFSGALGLGAMASDASASTPKPTPRQAKPKKPAAVARAMPAAAVSAARLSFKGTATDQTADVTARMADWPLGMAHGYAGQFLRPALSGQLDAQLDIHWQAATAGKPQVLRIAAPTVSVSDMQLAQGGASLASIARAALADVDIDVAGQSFKAASLQLSQPRTRLERDASQRWMYEDWLARGDAPARAAGQAKSKAGASANNAGSGSGSSTSASAKPNAGSGANASAPPWAVAVGEVLLDGGALSFSDKAGASPVAFEVTAATARLGGLALGGAAGKAQAAAPMPLSASLRLGAGGKPPGKLDFKGSLALAPLQASGQLAVERLPVQAFEPYFGGALNIDLLRADASFKGRVAYRQRPAGPQAEVSGDAALDDFRANTRAPAEDLLAWKSLNVRGLRVALEPGRATRVDVRETVLSDFFARVIVMPDGRINLQDLVKPAAPASATPTTSTDNALEKIAARAGSASTNAENEAKTGARPASRGASVTTSAAPVTSAAAPAGPAPIVNVGPISLVNGQVRFSDRFVKPNYSADLSELTGRLSAFSSVAASAPDGAPAATAMADLELRGKAEGTASLEILGKLNPLAKPLALDITGRVRDLELPPLSPYAIKYAGYGIERGKMSVDVNYVVLPDGRLTASNKLVLNQLSFGDKVPGATASLPVKLAVALLADRNGVIDLNLPISGSLNDPQFSLGPVIVKVILNVIVKAITAPFSLLAHALGGGDELAQVAFAPGSAQLSPEARAGLDKVAKALAERPALQLTVTGASSPEAERDAFQREQLAEQVRAEKRRQLARDGAPPVPAASETRVSPDEYPALLKAVYRKSELPKPRNLVGLVKDQPVPEMEKLLLAGIAAGGQELHDLALKRASVVRQYLLSRDLPPARLFLGAAKAVPPEAKWTPHAELNLAMP